jgi:hypothetical protein
MEVCQNCGRPRGPGVVFCTGCGQRFTAATGSAGSERRPARPRRRPPMALIATAAAVVVVAAGTGLFFWLGPGHQHIHTTAQGGLSSPVRSAPQAAQDSASVPSAASPAAAAPSPAPAPSTAGSVTVSAGAAQNPAATAIATFVSQYFSAINSHNFQAYDSLLTPQNQQGQTKETFSQGFGSSADSDEILVAINPATNGDTAATITFTSHQNAAQGADGTGTCTDWNITLFLESNGTGYLDGEAPSTYHAHPQSCS